MSFLGLVIVSTKKGPVVHEVKAGSPLEIVVFLGDRIIAVDGNDTQSMTASAVTKKMDQRRKITVLSVVTEVQNSSGLFFGDTKGSSCLGSSPSAFLFFLFTILSINFHVFSKL